MRKNSTKKEPANFLLSESTGGRAGTDGGRCISREGWFLFLDCRPNASRGAYYVGPRPTHSDKGPFIHVAAQLIIQIK